MIKKVHIKNYILIDELNIELSDGLNIITGETGAGKSILINALDIAFGARVGKDVIKNGEDKAIIELTVNNISHDLTTFYEEFGIDECESELIISREISHSGARSRVNGSLVNQEAIKCLKELFLDIHSQHQTYSFMQPKFHIQLLDDYAKDVYGETLGQYKLLYKKYLDFQKNLKVAEEAANTTVAQIDFLKFQIEEIESAEIQDVDEDERLTSELGVLENAEKLKELTGSAFWALNSDESSIIEALGKIKMNLSKASSMDENLVDCEQSLIDATEILRDLSSTLRDYSQNMENDLGRMNEIQERLFLFDKLKHKYGNTLQDVLNTLDKFKSELENIEFSTKNVESIKLEICKISQNLQKMAILISEKRKNYAEVLSSLIVEKLEKLELPKVKFKIEVTNINLEADGIDKVEFLISTNVSEDLKPLVKVASGGEISRVMLAIKSIFAQNDSIDTVIFDEIDTGISGKTLQCVADEIKELASSHQIIMITHQAIIASKSDKHFFVSKTQNDKTLVEIVELSGDEKLRALAQLASGDVTKTSLEFAKALIG